MKPNYVSRSYKISINFGLIFYYYSSRSYQIPKRVVPYLIGALYALFNILSGFWGFLGILRKFQGLINTFKALKINLSGGEDNSKLSAEAEQDPYSVYIFNNIEKPRPQSLTLDSIALITDVQELFTTENREVYSQENEDFITEKMEQIGFTTLEKKDIQLVFNAMKIYEKYRN